ncbi:hypothetical protein [Jiangella mangrovi]|uniref:Uncharacterized protein n=1 Tax=Jiangella mangrovi TaxID=1524084 RepID=A0A7W9GXV2_9ACTN|nr:hypothetical protein [Jiangella mangrovi]MBB5791646.1 hypothetical protein [Jiangella mangrovi]
MSVGFRSFLHTFSGPVVETVVDHVGRWSAAKEIDVDAGRPGRSELDADDVVTVLVADDDTGRRLYRWRRLHPLARGAEEIWRTTITAVEAGESGPGWMWVEIEVADEPGDRAPRVPFMSVPAVLRGLLPDLDCADGLVPVSTEPRWAGSADLPDLMDYLADESRLGPVYVARQGARDSAEFQTWATNVAWEVVSLGHMFLLPSGVEDEFNDMVGPNHAIPDAAIRTYLPGVRLDDPFDPRRHQILGSVRIDRTGPRRLSYILGLSQRDRTLSTPLPDEVGLVDSALTLLESRIADDAVVARLPVVTAPTGAGGVGAATRRPVADGVTHQSASGPAAGPDGAPVQVLTRRGQHRRLVELLSENDRLRAENDELRGVLNGQGHTGAAVVAALDALEQQVRSLRQRLGVDAADWRRLSAS